MTRPMTEWGNPDGSVTAIVRGKGGKKHKILSQYGEVTYREWCEREMERINAKGLIQVHIVTNPRFEIALSR